METDYTESRSRLFPTFWWQIKKMSPSLLSALLFFRLANGALFSTHEHQDIFPSKHHRLFRVFRRSFISFLSFQLYL